MTSQQPKGFHSHHIANPLLGRLDIFFSSPSLGNQLSRGHWKIVIFLLKLLYRLDLFHVLNNIMGEFPNSLYVLKGYDEPIIHLDPHNTSSSGIKWALSIPLPLLKQGWQGVGGAVFHPPKFIC